MRRKIEIPNWITCNKTITPIENMLSSHIRNCIKMLLRDNEKILNGYTTSTWILLFTIELEKRK